MSATLIFRAQMIHQRMKQFALGLLLCVLMMPHAGAATEIDHRNTGAWEIVASLADAYGQRHV